MENNFCQICHVKTAMSSHNYRKQRHPLWILLLVRWLFHVTSSQGLIRLSHQIASPFFGCSFACTHEQSDMGSVLDSPQAQVWKRPQSGRPANKNKENRDGQGLLAASLSSEHPKFSPKNITRRAWGYEASPLCLSTTCITLPSPSSPLGLQIKDY